MNNRVNFFKRLTAFLLAMLLVTTMMGDDFASLADEDVESSTEVSEESAASDDGGAAEAVSFESEPAADPEPAAEPEPVVDAEPAAEPGEETGVPQDPADPEIPADVVDSPTDTTEVTEDTVEGQTPVDPENIDNPEVVNPEEVEQPELTEEEKKALEEKELLEKLEEEEKECDHRWVYVSNNDGTHTVKCEECGEEDRTEDCEFEEGVCIHCGYKLLEEKECEHEYEYVSNDDGTHTKRCIKCGEEVIEDCEFDEDWVCKYCGYEDMTLTYQSVSKTIHGVKVTVSGEMPRNSRVTIYTKSLNKINDIVNEQLEEGTFTAFEAFDINIYDRHGDKYQPAEDDNTVEVTFEGVEELPDYEDGEIAAFRIEDDDETVTEIDCDVSGENVSFDAEHFSRYVVGTISGGNYVSLSSTQKFAYIGQGTANYTAICGTRFYTRYTNTGSTKFTVELRKNLTSNTDPLSGELLATQTYTMPSVPAGDYRVDIVFDSITEIDAVGEPTWKIINDNAYITNGSYYSIVVSMDNACQIGYGNGNIETYLTNATNVWSSGSYNGIFEEVSKTYTDITDTYYITKIQAADAAADGNGAYHYAKGDTDKFTATLSNPSVERTITWTSGNENVVKIDADGNMTAVGPGTTTITGDYNNKPVTVTVQVLNFYIGGTETIGDTASLNLTYDGTEQTPAVIAYSNASSSTVDVNTSYSDNQNVGKAKVTIKYTVDSVSTYTYERYFNIEAIDITATGSDGNTAFQNADYTMSGNEVTAVTNVNSNGAIKVGDKLVTPVFSTSDTTDFTVDVAEPIIATTGISYPMTITGKGNFTGSVSITKAITDTDVSKLFKVSLSDDSALLTATYKAEAYTLTPTTEGWSEVTFYDMDDNVVNEIITEETAEVKIYNKNDLTTEDAVNAGVKTIVFTMKNTSGYTGSLSCDFTIDRASLKNTTITWTGGKGDYKDQFYRDEEIVEGEDYTLKFNSTGVVIPTTDYKASFPDVDVDLGSYARMILSNEGTNFATDITKTGQYQIIAKYDTDLEIRITGSSGKGTASNNYATGYKKTFDNTEGTPSIYAYLPGIGPLTKDVDVTIEVFDDEACSKAVSKNVGTKYIKIAPVPTGSYKDFATVVGTYTVVACPINSSKVKVTKPSSTTNITFTGDDITLKCATGDSDASTSDIVIKYGTTGYLVKGTDYDISYTNNYNVGKASYIIEGKGNYSGTLSGSAYSFNITQAELSITDTQKAFAKVLANTYDPIYDGNDKTPDVEVKINNTNIIKQIDPKNNGKANYSLSYAKNKNQGTATVTVTGQNNLKGEVVLTFPITSNTERYTNIIIAETYTATPVPGGESESGGVYTRSYTSDYIATFTGGEARPSIKVYSKNNAELKYGVDYGLDYYNNVNAATYTVGNTTTSPYVRVTGIGNYAGSDAIIYFSIQKCTITEDMVTVPESYPWIDASTEVKAVPTVTYNGKTLAVDINYTVVCYDTYESESDHTELTTTAGTKYVVVRGKGDYDGEVVKTYKVGTDISEALVRIKSAYYSTSNEVFIPSAGTDMAVENTSLTTPFDVTWRYDKAPIIELFDTNMQPISTTYLASTEISSTLGGQNPETFPARVTSAIDDINYNIVTYKVTASGEGGFYGSTTVKYRILPQDINTVKQEDGKLKEADRMYLTKTELSQLYTGEELKIEPTYIFTYGSATRQTTVVDNQSCKLTGGTDFTPYPVNIGVDASTTLKEQTIAGVGNYTGTDTLHFEIKKGYIDVYIDSISDDTKLATTDAEKNQYEITGDNFPKYTYTGQEVKPNIILTNASGGVLALGTDYKITYDNNIEPTDGTSMASANITILNTNNFATSSIVVNYKILPNTLEGFTAVLGNENCIDYAAVALTPAEIKRQVETGDLPLVVSSGTKTLTRGEDYEIVVTNASTEAAVLAEIRKQSEYASETSTSGANSAPSYKTANWIYLKGLNTYSGYLKANFSIQLDLGSAYAQVTMPQRTYRLNGDGTLAESLNPVIKYVKVGATSGYTETLSNTTTLPDSTTVYNYTIKRDRNGLPGPDPTLSLAGQYACKGTAANLKYIDTTGTAVNICFLADLQYYGADDISIKNGTVYAYTGDVIQVEVVGDVISGATQAPGVPFEGDYVLEYYKATDTTKTTDAVDVGKWYVVLRASDNSDYFIPNSKTNTEAISFTIKYDLSKCTMYFIDEPGIIITSASYNPEKPFVFADHAVIEFEKADGTTVTVYYPEKNGIGYVGFSPESLSKITTDREITAVPSPSPNDYCMNKCTANFSITGLDINTCTVTLGGTSFDYTGADIKPTVTVEHPINGTLRNNIDYTVTYPKDAKNVGTKTVLIAGIGAYSGVVSKEYTINPVTITPGMVSLAAPVYYAGPGVVVKPSLVIKNGSDILDEGTEYIVTYPDSNKTAREDAYVTISQGTSENYLVPSPFNYVFTINKLDLRLADNVTISPDSAEFNGGTVNPYDVVTVALGDVTLVSEQDDATNCDYTIKVYNAANTAETTLTSQGSYILRIYGAHNCDETTYIEKDFTITSRSLEDNYHYYYEYGENPGFKGLWKYDSTNVCYETRGVKKEDDGSYTNECLEIYVYDIVSLDDGDTPKVVIYDKGRADKTNYELKDEEFTVQPFRNTEAASAEWSKTNTVDEKGGRHATAAATSPYIEITGNGDYAGTIRIPFNIGVNLNTITDLSVVYTMSGADLSTYTYDPDYADTVAWSFNEYNGGEQKPSTITVKQGNKTLPKKAYTISYTDGDGDKDSSIDAGYKYVVITGSGDYCGTIKQKYAINRKAITAIGGPFDKDVMETDGGELTFNFTGVAQPFTSATAKTYFVDTGLLTEEQAANYVGYYYSIYNGIPVEPTISVWDNTLKTPKKIDSSELDLEYTNKETVSSFENGERDLYSWVTVKFQATGADAGNLNKAGGNYYVPDAAISYQMNYIIIAHDIANDFNVRFINGTDGNKYNYDSGKPITPEIEVTNGSSEPLTEGVHYEVSYGTKKIKTVISGEETEVTIPGNITPGVTTITVTGIGNYSGEKTLDFYIWGNLSQTDTYYIDDNGNFVAGNGDIPVQQYTGTYITTGDPRVYLALPSQNSLNYDAILTYDTEYFVQNKKSDNSYVVDAWVEYAGRASAYWSGTKTVAYDIEYDLNKVKATNYEDWYYWTGKPIEPAFAVSIPTATVTGVTYKRNSASTTDTTSIGTIEASVAFKIGNESGVTKATYEIKPRPISECTVVFNKSNQRYTGKALKPASTVFIQSSNLKTGDSQTTNLTAGTDYKVDYGNYIYNNGTGYITLTGNTVNIVGTTTEAYSIVLHPVANLRVTENTGDSLTAQWVSDIFSNGTQLLLQEYDATSKTYKTVQLANVGGLTGKNTFTGLKGSTKYQIVARAFANSVDGTPADGKIYSEQVSTEAITDIATKDITVTRTSATKAKITWTETKDIVSYYIYRAEDETSEGKVIAIVPASTGSYTNSKLTSGVTYYYHIDGYTYIDGVWTRVNSSVHKPAVAP